MAGGHALPDVATDPMPEDLRRFILRSVPSIPFVEALLLFRGQAGSPLTIETVARRLYIPEREAIEIIEQLRAAHVIVAQDGGNRYAPDPEISGLLDQLASYYRSHLVEVTSLVHSRTGRMAQQFADAFKIRKD